MTAGDLASDLIDAGTDINAQSPDGNTAIKLAVLSGHGEMVKVLLAHGANLDSVKNLAHKKLYIRTEDRVVELGKLVNVTNVHL